MRGPTSIFWANLTPISLQVYAHALMHGIHIAANGNGEFYDRLG